MRRGLGVAAALLLTAGCQDDPGPSVDDADVVDAAVDVPTDVDRPEVADTPRLRFEVVGDRVDGVAASYLLVVAHPSEPAAVTFELDGDVVTTDDAPPYVTGISPERLADGPHSLVASAEVAGTLVSDTFEFEVDHVPPTLSLVEPGSATSGPDDEGLYVEIDVRDDRAVGQVWVRFDDSPATVRAWTAPPYSGTIPVGVLVAGEHVLHVDAVDAAGNRATTSRPFVVCGGERDLACAGACRAVDGYATDGSNCGGCGQSCDVQVERCGAGRCVCAPHASTCGERCVDLRVDVAHCGACDNACTGDEVCSNGVCAPPPPPGFVVIPPGTFTMGAPDGRFGASSIERPSRQVTITRPFLMATREVTQADWATWFDWGPASFSECGPDCPVETVSWWEAVAYTNTLSRLEGLQPCYALAGCTELEPGSGFECLTAVVDARRQNPVLCEGYRLPTEAEWEYAAQAGSSEATYAGSVFSSRCDYGDHIDAIAWTSCNADDGPRPTGRLAPNAFGLYDMIGNVDEWTTDYFTEPDGQAGVDPFFSDNGHAPRVIKGGSWADGLESQTASSRRGARPPAAEHNLGFRPVRTLLEDR